MVVMSPSRTVSAVWSFWQVDEHHVPGGAFDQGSDRGLVVRAGDVGSGRGAVPGLLPARFPDPPSAPDMRLSSHPALHG
jgi:hypothetical protein